MNRIKEYSTEKNTERLKNFFYAISFVVSLVGVMLLIKNYMDVDDPDGSLRYKVGENKYLPYDSRFDKGNSGTFDFLTHNSECSTKECKRNYSSLKSKVERCNRRSCIECNPEDFELENGACVDRINHNTCIGCLDNDHYLKCNKQYQLETDADGNPTCESIVRLAEENSDEEMCNTTSINHFINKNNNLFSTNNEPFYILNGENSNILDLYKTNINFPIEINKKTKLNIDEKTTISHTNYYDNEFYEINKNELFNVDCNSGIIESQLLSSPRQWNYYCKIGDLNDFKYRDSDKPIYMNLKLDDSEYKEYLYSHNIEPKYINLSWNILSESDNFVPIENKNHFRQIFECKNPGDIMLEKTLEDKILDLPSDPEIISSPFCYLEGLKLPFYCSSPSQLIAPNLSEGYQYVKSSKRPPLSYYKMNKIVEDSIETNTDTYEFVDNDYKISCSSPYYENYSDTGRYGVISYREKYNKNSNNFEYQEWNGCSKIENCKDYADYIYSIRGKLTHIDPSDITSSPQCNGLDECREICDKNMSCSIFNCTNNLLYNGNTSETTFNNENNSIINNNKCCQQKSFTDIANDPNFICNPTHIKITDIYPTDRDWPELYQEVPDITAINTIDELKNGNLFEINPNKILKIPLCIETNGESTEQIRERYHNFNDPYISMAENCRMGYPSVQGDGGRVGIYGNITQGEFIQLAESRNIPFDEDSTILFNDYLESPFNLCYNSSLNNEINGGINCESKNKENCASPCIYDERTDTCNSSIPLSSDNDESITINNKQYNPVQIKFSQSSNTNETGRKYLTENNYYTCELNDFKQCNVKTNKYKIGETFYQTSSCEGEINPSINYPSYEGINEERKEIIEYSPINTVGGGNLNKLLDCENNVTKFIPIERELLSDGYNFCEDTNQDGYPFNTLPGGENFVTFPINPPIDESIYSCSDTQSYDECLKKPYCYFEDNQCKLLTRATCKHVDMSSGEGYDKRNLESKNILRDYSVRTDSLYKPEIFTQCQYEAGKGYFPPSYYENINMKENMNCENNPYVKGNDDMSNMRFVDIPSPIHLFDEQGRSRLCSQGYYLKVGDPTNYYCEKCPIFIDNINFDEDFLPDCPLNNNSMEINNNRPYTLNTYFNQSRANLPDGDTTQQDLDHYEKLRYGVSVPNKPVKMCKYGKVFNDQREILPDSEGRTLRGTCTEPSCKVLSTDKGVKYIATDIFDDSWFYGSEEMTKKYFEPPETELTTYTDTQEINTDVGYFHNFSFDQPRNQQVICSGNKNILKNKCYNKIVENNESVLQRIQASPGLVILDPGSDSFNLDIDKSGEVGVEDLLDLLSDFGKDGASSNFQSDISGDDLTDIDDLLSLLAGYGGSDNLNVNSNILDHQPFLPPLLSSPCEDYIDVGLYNKTECLENDHIWIVSETPSLENNNKYFSSGNIETGNFSTGIRRMNNVENSGYCIEPDNPFSDEIIRILLENDFNPEMIITDNNEIPDKFRRYISENKKNLNKFVDDNSEDYYNLQLIEGFNNIEGYEDYEIYNRLVNFFHNYEKYGDKNNYIASPYQNRKSSVWGLSSPAIVKLNSNQDYIEITGNYNSDYPNWIDGFNECGWEANLDNVSSPIRKDIANTLSRKCNRLMYFGTEYDVYGNTNIETAPHTPTPTTAETTETPKVEFTTNVNVNGQLTQGDLNQVQSSTQDALPPLDQGTSITTTVTSGDTGADGNTPLTINYIITCQSDCQNILDSISNDQVINPDVSSNIIAAINSSFTDNKNVIEIPSDILSTVNSPETVTIDLSDTNAILETEGRFNENFPYYSRSNYFQNLSEQSGDTDDIMQPSNPGYSKVDDDFNKLIKGDTLPSFCSTKRYNNNIICSYNTIDNPSDIISGGEINYKPEITDNYLFNNYYEWTPETEPNREYPTLISNHSFITNPGKIKGLANISSPEWDYQQMLWKVDGEGNPDQPYNIMSKPNPIRPLGICPGYKTITDDKGPDNIQKKNDKQYNTFDSQTFKLNGLDVDSSFSCISKTCYVNDSNSIDFKGGIKEDSVSNYFKSENCIPSPGASTTDDQLICGCDFTRSSELGSIPSGLSDIDEGEEGAFLSEVLPWPIIRAQSYLSCGGGLNLEDSKGYDVKNDPQLPYLDPIDIKDPINMNIPDYHIKDGEDSTCYDLNVDIFNAWYYSIQLTDLHNSLPGNSYPDISYNNKQYTYHENPTTQDQQDNFDYKIVYFESVICADSWGGYLKAGLKENYLFISDDVAMYPPGSEREETEPSEEWKNKTKLPRGWIFNYSGETDENRTETIKSWIINRYNLKKTFENNLKFISPTGFCGKSDFNNNKSLSEKLRNDYNSIWWPLNGPNLDSLPGNSYNNISYNEIWRSGENILTKVDKYKVYDELIKEYEKHTPTGDSPIVNCDDGDDDTTLPYRDPKEGGCDIRMTGVFDAEDEPWTTTILGEEYWIKDGAPEDGNYYSTKSQMNLGDQMGRITLKDSSQTGWSIEDSYATGYIKYANDNNLKVTKDYTTKGGHEFLEDRFGYYTEFPDSGDTASNEGDDKRDDDTPVYKKQPDEYPFTNNYKSDLNIPYKTGSKYSCQSLDKKYEKNDDQTEQWNKYMNLNEEKATAFYNELIPESLSDPDKINENWTINMKPWLSSANDSLNPVIDPRINTILNKHSREIKNNYNNNINAFGLVEEGPDQRHIWLESQYNNITRSYKNDLGKSNISTIVRSRDSRFDFNCVDFQNNDKINELPDDMVKWKGSPDREKGPKGKSKIKGYSEMPMLTTANPISVQSKSQSWNEFVPKDPTGKAPGFSEWTIINPDSVKEENDTTSLWSRKINDKDRAFYGLGKDAEIDFLSPLPNIIDSKYLVRENIPVMETGNYNTADYSIMKSESDGKNLPDIWNEFLFEDKQPINFNISDETRERKKIRQDWLNLYPEYTEAGIGTTNKCDNPISYKRCKYNEECGGLCIKDSIEDVPQLHSWTNPWATGYADWYFSRNDPYPTTISRNQNGVLIGDSETGICQFGAGSTIRKLPDYGTDEPYVDNTRNQTGGSGNISWDSKMDKFCSVNNIDYAPINPRLVKSHPAFDKLRTELGTQIFSAAENTLPDDNKKRIGKFSVFQNKGGPSLGNPCPPVANSDSVNRELSKKCIYN